MIEKDVIIIGAGAAGLMCASIAASRQRQVTVLEHANKPGKKILMSGGGRCNFTNYQITPEKYLSQNKHFCKSALSRYTQWDFIELVKRYKISFHEKKHGQLFCDEKAKDIVNMLLSECEKNKVQIKLNESVTSIEKINDNLFSIKTAQQEYRCQSLVIASGGLSIPTMGASPFGYKVAEQFGINIWPTRAGLVPVTLHQHDKERFSTLSGISNNAVVTCQKQSFKENILFTHRGLSGPAIIQISNYWVPGREIEINLLPDINLLENLKREQKKYPKRSLKEYISEYVSKRVAQDFLTPEMAEKKLQSISHSEFQEISNIFHHWIVKPNGTEGYRTAEVTLGGVDCNAISSKTMECNDIKGLYFIGEVLDVTGWLGGYNFQWAWSSGWAAGQVV
ncbi:MAG: NAD(P)/FAD-dependent oxidoreductase [Gammaproteobacteria bacterium]|jgi:predicted Rossmann fold flavoprotein|nr:NAD(P)/FAD-dependent oxidoreductase [Gammaproteobacteria bacterium]